MCRFTICTSSPHRPPLGARAESLDFQASQLLILLASLFSIWAIFSLLHFQFQHVSQGFRVSHSGVNQTFDLTSLYRTGATGYIGGDGLFVIANAHPDWQFSALVRSEDKSKQVTSKYPQIRTVIGDLDSSELIEEEVKNADIVFRTCIQAYMSGYCH